MVQNLKVDIIYHQTPSDFEMEFNLGSCCRMRMLNEKTTDKKSFIKALARDVTRSRVIIGCGPLFSDDGIISMVAKAIGSGLAVCDNKTYGINSEEQIHIINGSTPLVTPDGYFGGCIIESGPQTIILLTENRAFRKAIMQNLIHPYIEEISYTPPNASTKLTPAAEKEPVYEATVTENEIYLTQPDEDYDDKSIGDNAYTSSNEDEHNIEFVIDEPESETCDEPQEAEPIVDNAYDIMYTEIEHPDEIKKRYEQTYTTSESDSMFIAETEYYDEQNQGEPQKSTRGMDITIVVLVLLLLLAVLALVYLIVLKPITMGVGIGDYIKEIFGSVSSNSLGV